MTTPIVRWLALCLAAMTNLRDDKPHSACDCDRTRSSLACPGASAVDELIFAQPGRKALAFFALAPIFKTAYCHNNARYEMKYGVTENPFSGKQGIEEALKRLNAKMVYAGLEPVELVSCGGASLNLMGWVSRSTSDVDILCAAQVDPKGKVRLQPDKPLPPRFTELVAEVGRELGIKQEWLNFGPAPLVEFGLPPGLERRLKRKRFGRCLALHIISRLDQIHLKIYAAMDPKTRLETHLSDLLDLEPTAAEAQAAVRWLMDRKTSPAFRRKLKQVLNRIGHEQLAEKLPD